MLPEVKQKLFAKSDRVKSADFHPTEPWLITSLLSGIVNIYHIETGALITTFQVTRVPVRCVRFVARKGWFVTGSDDCRLRAFDIKSGDKIVAFEAHPDYIRCLLVHPTVSAVLTGSDDMKIKAWDWENGWKCIQVYEGHTHYVMSITINPIDHRTFASVSLDRTVKIWSFRSGQASHTLEAHNEGLNYVGYHHGRERPRLVTSGDDRLAKIWDYRSKSYIGTLESHTSNVTFAIFHPFLPIIISGSEDDTVKIWDADTYRLKDTLILGLERAWCVACREGANHVAVGFDQGIVVLQFGREEPNFNMESVTEALRGVAPSLEALGGTRTPSLVSARQARNPLGAHLTGKNLRPSTRSGSAPPPPRQRDLAPPLTSSVSFPMPSSPIIEPKNLTIFTSLDHHAKVLKAETQIVLTVTPMDQEKLFVSQTPVAWKVLNFNPNSEVERTCTWQPSAGFTTVRVDDADMVTTGIGTHIPVRSWSQLENVGGKFQWSRWRPLDDSSTEIIMARNATLGSRALALCSVEGTAVNRNWRFEPFLHFTGVKKESSVTVGPPVMLQAYALSGYKENQLLSLSDRNKFILSSFEGEPEPIDLRKLEEHTSFLLYSNHAGMVKLEID